MITGETILGEENLVWRKATLFIPATEDNIDFCEKYNSLALIQEEGIEVEVELEIDETELKTGEMYDILLYNKPVENIAGEWLTLKAF